MFKSKKLVISLCAIVLCVALVLSASVFASAEEVIVEEYKNTELEFERIYGTSADHQDPWQSEGYLEQNPSAGSYKLYTNSYCVWWQADAFDFAYKKLDFSYGNNGTLVLESTLNSWNASMSDNAGAGIMLRTSLSPGAANVFLHARPGQTMVIYRASQGAATVIGKTQSSPVYPVGMKMVLNKNKVVCYLKQKGQSDYSKFATIPFVSGSTIYAGLAGYTVNELDMALADFSGYHAYVQTPEGAEKVDPDASSSEGGTSSDATSSEDEIKLPEDPKVQENVLMRETFTSGKLVHDEEKYPNQVNWDYNSKFSPIIETNSDNTNRYLYNWMDTSAFFIAGNQEWTDYTMSVDLTFTPDFSDEGANKFYILVRHHDISMYGAHDYVIGFDKVLDKQSVFMGRRNSTSTQYAAAEKITVKGDTNDILSTEYNWLPQGSEFTAKVKIKCFDNVITVWIDDVLVLRYTDNTNALNAKGSIGFVSLESAVKIDNVVVIDEIDLLGGDYDNEICGNWDKEIPSLVQEYIDKKYYGYSSAPYVQEDK